MLTTATTESASNWDFTQVFDLLRSPLQDIKSKYAQEDALNCSPSSEGHSNQGLTPCASVRPDEIKRQRSYPKLGDFGLVWDLLKKESRPHNDLLPEEFPPPSLDQISTLKILKRLPHDEPAQGTPSTSHKSDPVAKLSKSAVTNQSTPRQPVSILKPAAGSCSTKSDVTALSPPQTLPRAIGNPSKPTKISRVNNRTKATGKVTKSNVNPETIHSESSTGVDSDSSVVVFDEPITKMSGVLVFVPTQVGSRDVLGHREDTPPSSYDDADWTFASNTTPDTPQNFIITSAGIQVLPAAYKTATDRRIGLVSRLLRDFPEYGQLLSQMGRSPTLTKKSVELYPIHVFVDMSNILVGFHDAVKVSRNIPVTTRIRRLRMSFARFSLIMERGRPAAKRVLVGSDRLPSITEAEQLGYETNILDRVHKVKHTTPRPSKSRKSHGSANHSSSEPETAGGERWVEQGVDEILHLKMLESIVDTDEPSTIVLATGDAAVAEYSGGFMRMVERALQRGWSVELVSFSQVTSYAYRKKEFRAKWGSRFRIIELDTYVEELFD
ncbi:hypothetical protein F1880_004351 [Penicillium rolfsii]|nr:hypothetical protein F1880_004351 [Penicillium rolfsii]